MNAEVELPEEELTKVEDLDIRISAFGLRQSSVVCQQGRKVGESESKSSRIRMR